MEFFNDSCWEINMKCAVLIKERNISFQTCNSKNSFFMMIPMNLLFTSVRKKIILIPNESFKEISKILTIAIFQKGNQRMLFFLIQNCRKIESQNPLEQALISKAMFIRWRRRLISLFYRIW